MVSSIIWASIWLIVFALYATFNRRMYEWVSDRRKSQKLKTKVYWKTKEAFRWNKIGITATTVLFALWSLNSALALYKSITEIAYLTIPPTLKTIVNTYLGYLYTPLLVLSAGVLLWYAVQSLQNFNLAPIFVKNNSGQELSIYIRNQLVGVANPGFTVQNSKFMPVHKTYLIEAKDSDVKVVFSKEFSADELTKIDGKVEIPS